MDVVLGVLGMIVGIAVGVWATKAANAHSTRIARKSGAFKRPELEIELLGVPLNRAPEESPTICLLHPGKQGEPALYPIGFRICNVGDKNCTGAVLLIQATRGCIPTIDEEGIAERISPGVFAEHARRKLVTLDKLNQLSYVLPPLNPKLIISLCDSFCLRPMFPFEGSSRVTTADGVDVEFGYAYFASHMLTITLLVEDQPGVSYHVKLACMPASSLPKATERFQSDIVERRIQHLRSMPRIARIRTLWRQRHLMRSIVFVRFLRYKPVEVDGTRMFDFQLDDSETESCVVRYRGAVADWWQH